MPQQTRRYIFFAIAILAGIGAGIAFGWSVDLPWHSGLETPSLHLDYQADYALMVSVLYANDGDLAMALARLTFLGKNDPLILLNTAVQAAEDRQYAPDDLALMRSLQAAAQKSLPPSP